ncbi:MAG TPA: glycerol-3-phosphate acyltransferase [Candidatus Babeliales bacterium]|nr:glycerol-3-phosphate acyltransferase [Candidatus Babeliales bacterium]
MNFSLMLMSIIGYVIGSWSPGELIARFHGLDITNRGSGGTGATNVARFLGAKYFVLIFLIDCFKSFGYLKLLQSAHYHADVQACAALALLLGNTFSVFLNFKGGKGIATGFGILLALAGSTLPILVGVWAIAFYITKTVGLASAAALAGLFFYALLLSFNAPQLAVVLGIIALIGLWRHIDNVRRYLYSA